MVTVDALKRLEHVCEYEVRKQQIRATWIPWRGLQFFGDLAASASSAAMRFILAVTNATSRARSIARLASNSCSGVVPGSSRSFSNLARFSWNSILVSLALCENSRALASSWLFWKIRLWTIKHCDSHLFEFTGYRSCDTIYVGFSKKTLNGEWHSDDWKNDFIREREQYKNPEEESNSSAC